MRVGFVHGVMNTDNMSILGLTIDYGPYGWLEGYDPTWTPNTTDAQGRRYRYGNQPHIAHWNLARLAEALLPLVDREKRSRQGSTLYAETFNARLAARAHGRSSASTSWSEADDELLRGLFEALAEAETDFTLFFRNLAAVPLRSETRSLEPLRRAFYADDARVRCLERWLARYAARVRLEGLSVDRAQRSA